MVSGKIYQEVEEEKKGKDIPQDLVAVGSSRLVDSNLKKNSS